MEVLKPKQEEDQLDHKALVVSEDQIMRTVTAPKIHSRPIGEGVDSSRRNSFRRPIG